MTTGTGGVRKARNVLDLFGADEVLHVYIFVEVFTGVTAETP